jgi:hypothetical protein
LVPGHSPPKVALATGPWPRLGLRRIVVPHMFSFMLRRRAALAALGWLLAVPARAEDIVFPAEAGVVDVTQAPYNARGDGRTDDTEAIQQALLDHPNRNAIVYLPNGTYLLSAPLRWPGGRDEEDRQRATILQGQSRTGAVLRLADYSAAFANSGRARAMLWLGTTPASHHRNAVRNLTLHTGEGNPGASGIALMANRQGGVRDVTIVAGGKGDGGIGLDLQHSDAIGPCLIRNVRVEGFDFGLRTAYLTHSATVENLELAGQKNAGIKNSGQCLQVYGLRSTNGLDVPALQNADVTGFVTLVDARIDGRVTRRTGAGIVNRGLMYARGVTFTGYPTGLENRGGARNPVSGAAVAEFTSHGAYRLFPAPERGLGLPVEPTPDVPWDPPATWASPRQFGGAPDDAQDDSAALQQAVDSGATTVYLPNGTWIVRKTVLLRGNVRRLIGCEARVFNDGLRETPSFRVVDGASPVVRVERLEVDPGYDTFIELAAKRTLVLSACHDVRATFTAPGDVFLEDVSSRFPWEFKGNRVWARQWNIDREGLKVVNDGGQLWVLGLKVDRLGTAIRTVNGGRTEVLGGLCVSGSGYKADPLFEVQEASASFVIGESSFFGSPFEQVVAETRRGVTRQMPSRGISSDLPLPERVGGVGLTLFAAYDGPGAVPPPIPGVSAPPR